MIYSIVVIFVILFSVQATAGEVLEDMIDDLCSSCELNEILSNAHRELKNSVPIYSETKDLLVDGVNTLMREYTEHAASLICVAVREFRDQAVRAGTQSIPNEIYDRFRPFFGQDLLNDIEYRIGQDDELSIQTILFPLGASAITLDHVIVFRSHEYADNLWMWAHELEHVRQVRRYGLDGFCEVYVQDFLSLEEEADKVADHLAADFAR